MARIRTIKPEFFTSEDIVALSPMARLLYIAIWCEADKDGRLEWKPRTMKLRYFPGDECDINALADELLSRRLVVLYGEGLAHVPAFSKHQHINPRETASRLPAPDQKSPKTPPATADVDASARVADASLRDSDAQVGREGKGREKNPPTPRRGKGFDPTSIEIPDWLDRELWERWCKDRRDRKKPITEEGARSQLSRLDAFRQAGQTPRSVLEHAMAAGHQGLYPPAPSKAPSPSSVFEGAL